MTAVAEQPPEARISWFNDPKIRSLIVQAFLLAILAWLAYEIVKNTTENLRALNQSFGWSFLRSTAGFDIIQRPIFYQNTSTFGRALLIGFMIPTTLIFHTNFADPNQMIHFMKNLAITGGLLYLATYGPGPMSLDRRMSGEIEMGSSEETMKVRRRASA